MACITGFGEPEVAVSGESQSQYYLIKDISTGHNS